MDPAVMSYLLTSQALPLPGYLKLDFPASLETKCCSSQWIGGYHFQAWAHETSL